MAAFGSWSHLNGLKHKSPTERKRSTCLIKSFGLSLISEIWGERYANVHTSECKFHAFFPLPLIPVTYRNTSTSELWFHFVMWSRQFQIMCALQIKSLPLLSTWITQTHSCVVTVRSIAAATNQHVALKKGAQQLVSGCTPTTDIRQYFMLADGI